MQHLVCVFPRRHSKERGVLLLSSMQLWFHVGATTQVIGFHLVYHTIQMPYVVNCFSSYCLHVESKLFFKQPTIWKPRISRDLMISVASEISGHHGPSEGAPQLPVQVRETFISHICMSLFVLSSLLLLIAVVIIIYIKMVQFVRY